MDDNYQFFSAITAEMLATYRKKNADYGNAFEQTMDEEGIAAARIRLTDKLNRFKNLTRAGHTQQVSDESVLDTLGDLASYAIMTMIYLQKNPCTSK